MFIDDEYHSQWDKEEPGDMRRLLTLGTIANYVSQCATLALSLQMTSLYQHRISHLFPDRLSVQIPKQFAAIVASTSVNFEAAKRGVLVERELLEIDDVDMGWLIAEVNKTVLGWVKGNEHSFIGLSVFLTPLIIAAGFELSQVEKLPSPINLETLRSVVDEFIENTTPEDTVSYVHMLFDFGIEDPLYVLNSELSFDELIEDILDGEINLASYFKRNASRNILYNEITGNYKLTFVEGWNAFSEAWNETGNFSIAINHTYFSLLACTRDSTVQSNHSYKTADWVKRRAYAIVEEGGFLTATGRKLASALDEDLFERRIVPRTIAEMTTAVTFIGILQGYRV